MNTNPIRAEQARPWLGWLGQGLLVALLALAAWWLVQHALGELRARGAQAGFDIFDDPAGFQIGEGWLAGEPTQALWRAFLAGVLNTLRVALPAIVLTTLLGTLVGVGRLSRNPLARALSTGYVETIRNVPMLVQLLMAYFALTHLLPDAMEPLRLAPGWYLSKGGLAFPWPAFEAGHAWPQLSLPEVGRFNVTGGAAITPEYLAVLLALSLYTASFVAEIVRAGIESVPAGQVAASRALGLRGPQQLRFVVLPQALRVIVPSLGNQYLNLAKNSSLGVAVGYPELVSVTHTALNQTGRAFECIAVMMAVYLLLSLLIAAAVNGWNMRVARWGR